MYVDAYSLEFHDQVLKYPQLRKKIRNAIKRVLQDPRYRTELCEKKGGYDYRGIRSTHVGDAQFVILFGICDEYLKKFPVRDRICRACATCPSNTVLFLTVGPHNVAYKSVIR